MKSKVGAADIEGPFGVELRPSSPHPHAWPAPQAHAVNSALKSFKEQRLRRARHGHLHTSAYVSIRQHTLAEDTSAYVSIRQHTSAYVSIRQHTIRQHTSVHVIIRQHTSAYVSKHVSHHTSEYASIRQNTSAYVSIRAEGVSIRQHTSAYVSIRQHTS